ELTAAASRSAVGLHENRACVAAALLAAHGVADLDEPPARGVTVLAVDDHVQRLLRADVVAGPTENAGRLVDMVDGVALEAAERGGDRLLVIPGELDGGHVHPFLRRKDGRLLAVVVVRFPMVVGRLDDGQRFGVAGDGGAEERVDRTRSAMTPGDGIDDERTTVDAVPGCQ